MTESATPPGEPTAAEHAEAPALPDGKTLVNTCLTLLAAKAWEAMGLVASSHTKQIERNLDDAQLVIDAAAALADVMRARVPDAERREVETLITNLRLNFVEQKRRAT